MKISTKLQLSRLSVKLIIISIAYLFCAAIFSLFVAMSYDFIPSNIKDFIALLSIYAGGLLVASGILCVCLNLGIIAERKLSTEELSSPSKLRLGLWLGVGVPVLIVLACAVFYTINCMAIKDRRSEMKTRTELLVKNYQSQINELPAMLSDTARFRQVTDLLSVMANQQESLNEVKVIFQDSINSAPTMVYMSSYEEVEMLKTEGFVNNQYSCSDEKEYDFLTHVFVDGKFDTPYYNVEERYNCYSLYPFESKGKRFVLRFSL